MRHRRQLSQNMFETNYSQIWRQIARHAPSVAKGGGGRRWPRYAGLGISPADWNPARLSGDQFRPGLAARLAGFSTQLALGTGPVLERISRCATALQTNMVGAQRDLFRGRMYSGCPWLSHGCRGTFHILGHTPPFDCCFYLTISATPSLRNSLEMQSKDSIVQIEETGSRADGEQSWKREVREI